MEYKVEKVTPAKRLEMHVREEKKGNENKSFKDTNNNGKYEQDEKNEEKNNNATRESIKEKMEAESKSHLYRLMSIMNKDTEEAIKYLAELSKSNAKTKKPRRENDDVYNR